MFISGTHSTQTITVHVYSCQGVGVVPPVMFVWYTSVYTCLPTTVYPSAPQTQEQGDKLPVCFPCPTHVHPPQKYLPCLMCSGSCALPAKAVNCSAYSCFSRVVSHKYNKAIPQSHNCLMLGDQCPMMHDTIELPHGEIAHLHTWRPI